LPAGTPRCGVSGRAAGGGGVLLESMHEVGIIEEAVRLAIETAKSAKAGRVHRLRLRVGVLSGVVPDALHFSFDMACRGTLAEGASLEIETVPAACWCATCQAEFECEDFIDDCPRCHQPSGELRRGRELELAAVEMS
jgi:hydrogenase nickel incorporation protein HypA/HybF